MTSRTTNKRVLKRGESAVLERLGRLADAQGIELYAVGGFVRDRLLGKKVKDIDFTVIGDAVAFARIVADSLGARNPVLFERFGTAMVPYRGFQLDFVTARAESYESQSRKPKVWEGALDDDLARRDFTVNALAACLNDVRYGELVDHYDGMGDLQRKLLRTPKEPEQTFSEDPLRIMRALRFAAQLEFQLDPATLAACRTMASRLDIVSQERITDELLKLMSARKPSIGLRLMQETGVMRLVFKEIAELAGVEQIGQHHHKDVFDHTLLVVDKLAELTEDPVMRLAALVHDIAKPRTKRFFPDLGWTFHGHEDVGSRMLKPISRRLKLPEKTAAKLMKMTALHMRPINLTREEVTDSAVRRLIVDAGEDLGDLMLLCKADITSANPKKVKRYLNHFEQLTTRIAEVIEGDQLRAFQSPVRGEEIMQICNLSPGPLVGKIKTALEEAILDGRVANEHDAVLAYLLEIKAQYLEN
ncbi:MAG: HD domain-containing protein [bacterium]|nr:HD domain-containing protein [bacterium]